MLPSQSDSNRTMADLAISQQVTADAMRRMHVAGDPQPLPPGGKALPRPSHGEIIFARAVAMTIEHSLQEQYGEAVNVRCHGSVDGNLCVLSAAWNRGREVFHRRYTFDPSMRGGLPQIGRRLVDPLRAAIDSTEGADRP